MVIGVDKKKGILVLCFLLILTFVLFLTSISFASVGSLCCGDLNCDSGEYCDGYLIGECYNTSPSDPEYGCPFECGPYYATPNGTNGSCEMIGNCYNDTDCSSGYYCDQGGTWNCEQIGECLNDGNCVSSYGSGYRCNASWWCEYYYVQCFLDKDNDGYTNGTYEYAASCSPDYYLETHFTNISEIDCDDNITNCTTDCFTLAYLDNDGDGFGDTSISAMSCEGLGNYVLDNTDCDDNTSIRFPGNIESCDGIDNNCSGFLDYNAYEFSFSTGNEVCTNGLDDDCDGLSDYDDSDGLPGDSDCQIQLENDPAISDSLIYIGETIDIVCSLNTSGVNSVYAFIENANSDQIYNPATDYFCGSSETNGSWSGLNWSIGNCETPLPISSYDVVCKINTSKSSVPPGSDTTTENFNVTGCSPGTRLCASGYCSSHCYNLGSGYDIDGDGILNKDDPDIDGPGDGFDNTNDFTDSDGNGINNDVDVDIDADNISNIFDPNIDGDGLDNYYNPDIDGDGIHNLIDIDNDNDGILDFDDDDIDGDGILNVNDDYFGNNTLCGTWTAQGTGGSCSNIDNDDDNDGIYNWNDDTPTGIGTVYDIDGDGTLNQINVPNIGGASYPLDINGDGVIDQNEASYYNDYISGVFDDDIDGDGLNNSVDPDIDGDGILNLIDIDMDGDMILNVYDKDDDADGILDYNETTFLDNGLIMPVNEASCNYDGNCDSGESCLCFDCFGKEDSCSQIGGTFRCALGDCLTSYCGNGIVDNSSGEECDDGNWDQNDSCVYCRNAVCGDEYIYSKFEDCDAGVQNGVLSCASDCYFDYTAASNISKGRILNKTEYDSKVNGSMIRMYLVDFMLNSNPAYALFNVLSPLSYNLNKYVTPDNCLLSTKPGESCNQIWFVKVDDVSDMEIYNLPGDLIAGNTSPMDPIMPLRLYPNYEFINESYDVEVVNTVELKVKITPNETLPTEGVNITSYPVYWKPTWNCLSGYTLAIDAEGNPYCEPDDVT